MNSLWRAVGLGPRTPNMAPDPALSVSVTEKQGEGEAVGVGINKKVPGSTVIITGGSQGVGRDLARLYAKRGCNVVLVARQEGRLESVAEECRKLAGRPDSALAVPGDVSDAAFASKLMEAVQHKFERVDVVVNCAGVCATGPLDAMPEEDISWLMNINFLGPALISRAFIPLLKASANKPKGISPRPTIAMVNSWAARMPLKGMSVYCASKQALAGFADALRYELQPEGVNVVQVHPGVINSDYLSRARFYGEGAERAQKAQQELLGSGKAQTTEMVAQAVMAAIDHGDKETVVGATFKALVAGYHFTGINPLAWMVKN